MTLKIRKYHRLLEGRTLFVWHLIGWVKVPKLCPPRAKLKPTGGVCRVMENLAYAMKDLETSIWLDNSLCHTAPQLKRRCRVLVGKDGKWMTRAKHGTMGLGAPANPVLTQWLKAAQHSY